MKARFAVCSLSVIGAALLLFSGCAQPPTEELEAAQSALAGAREAGASTLASESFAAAQAKLTEAESLVDDGEYDEAKLLLEEAARLAAEAQQEAADAQRAAEEAAKAAEEARVRALAEPVVKTSHTVVRGEYLWKIAGYSDVYGDPYQWTRIFNANRDKINDPDLIYPEQVLALPR